MLKFNPANYISFTPNSQEKLQGGFIITNPTNNCTAAFKIKSTRPELFIVKPYVGMIAPLQQIQVIVCTLAVNSQELARQIAHEHKFLVQYAMFDRVPSSLPQGLQGINQNNKQLHKLYINTNTVRGLLRDDAHDAHSALSNHYSFHSLRQHHDQQLHNKQNHHNYDQMGSQDKFQHLKDQIDKMEWERSELIMASKPHNKQATLIKFLVVIIVLLIAGNLTGHAIGLHSLGKSTKQKKQREYRYFGLQKYWAEEQPNKQAHHWWQFWS